MNKKTFKLYNNFTNLYSSQVVFLQTRPVDKKEISHHVLKGEIANFFKDYDYKFIYLPEIIQNIHEISTDLLSFNYPLFYNISSNLSENAINNRFVINSLSRLILDHYKIPLTDFVGLMFFHGESVVLIEIDSNFDIKELRKVFKEQFDPFLPFFLDADFSPCVVPSKESITRYEKLHGEVENLADELFPIEAHQLAYDIMQRVEKLKRGGFERLVIEGLSQLLIKSSSVQIDERNSLSRVFISKEFRINLMDYGNIEIELTPLQKVVFIFFIKHPEGVIFKKLFEHRKELIDLYKQISLREDILGMNRSIDELIDPTKNSINEKCSRIKEAFIKLMDDCYAQNYYVTGDRGSKKSISLDRILVVWENEVITEFKLAKTEEEVEKDKAQEWDLFKKASNERIEGNRTSALKHLNELIQRNPYFNKAYIIRAIVHFELQDYTLAVEDNTKAIELNDLSMAPYYNRALVYYIQKKFDKALIDISKYIEIRSPDDQEGNSNAYKLRGDVYVKLDKKDLALSDYKLAYDLGNNEARDALKSIN